MSAQTSYKKTMEKSVPGVVAWDFGTTDTTTITATAEVVFGTAVTKAGANGKTDVLGFAIRDLMSHNAIENNVTAYGAKESIGLLREGYMFVRNDSSATKIDTYADVYINATGKVVASGDTGAVLLQGCRVEDGAAAGGVMLIRVHVNNPQA